MAALDSRRKEIRKQVVKILNGRTRARNNVRANRSEANWQENLPAINLYFRGERIEEMDQAPRRMRRFMELEVEIIDEGKDGDELSDKLDDLAEEVERMLSIDDSLGCTADDILLSNISDMEASSDGEKPVGAIKLLYEIKYNTFAPRSIRDQGNFPDLKKVGAEYDLQPGQESADRANDLIDVTTP